MICYKYDNLKEKTSTYDEDFENIAMLIEEDADALAVGEPLEIRITRVKMSEQQYEDMEGQEFPL